MMHFLLLLKLARVPLKNCFRLAIIVPGQCKYILMLPHGIKTCAHAIISSTFPNIFFKDFLIHIVPHGFQWFLLVPLGYPCLPLVIYNSNICEIICLFAIIFLSFAEIFSSLGQIKKS